MDFDRNLRLLKIKFRCRLSCQTKTHLPTFYQYDTSIFHHGVSFKTQTVKNGGTEMIYYSLLSNSPNTTFVIISYIYVMMVLKGVL